MQTPGAGVCPRCGEWSEPWAVSAAERKMACPGCGYEAPFLRLPLFVITGASGSGKTAMGERLVPELRGKCVVLDRDLLWREEFREKLEAFNSLWLRIARQVAQAGLPVLMYGTTLPEHIEGLGERVYFSEVHYLALTCSDAELVARLEGRPAWRGSASPEFVGKMREFNCVDQEQRRGDETADDAARHVDAVARRGHRARGRVGARAPEAGASRGYRLRSTSTSSTSAPLVPASIVTSRSSAIFAAPPSSTVPASASRATPCATKK